MSSISQNTALPRASRQAVGNRPGMARHKPRIDEDGKFVAPELDDMFRFFPVQQVRHMLQPAPDAVAADPHFLNSFDSVAYAVPAQP